MADARVMERLGGQRGGLGWWGLQHPLSGVLIHQRPHGDLGTQEKKNPATLLQIWPPEGKKLVS
jgi:hypothetical protein